MLTMATRGMIGFRLVVTYALPILLLVERSTGECRFEYRKQPPSYAQLTDGGGCNPYMMMPMSPDAMIKISLECVVRRQPGVNDLFEIRWFRKNTTEGVEDLGRGDPDMALGDVDWSSRYHNMKLFNQQYNPSFVGKYWCQVINTTADPDQPLMRSNVFTLLPPENYTGSTCSGAAISSPVQVIDNATCADLPVHSELNTLQDASVVTQTTHLPHFVMTTIIMTSDVRYINTTTVLSAAPTPSAVTTHPPTGSWVYTMIAVVGVVIVVTTVTVITATTVLLLLRRWRQTQNDLNHDDKDQQIKYYMDIKTSYFICTGKSVSVDQQTAYSPRNNSEMAIHSNNRKEVCQLKEISGQHIAGSVNEETFINNPSPPPPHPPPHGNDHHSSTSPVYQPLNTATTDYTSVYATPTSAGRKGIPLVEVEGKMYSIVDPTTRENEHTYSTPQ